MVAKGVGDVDFSKKGCRSQGDQQVCDRVNRLVLYPEFVRVDAIVDGGAFGKRQMLNCVIFWWIGMLLGNDPEGRVAKRAEFGGNCVDGRKRAKVATAVKFGEDV